MMKEILAGLAGCALALSAAAKDQACVIQGEFVENGTREVVNNCLANKGMKEADFGTACRDLLEAYRDGRSAPSASKISMKPAGSCPAAHKAVCEGAFGHKVSWQFAQDDSWLKSSQARQACEAEGGRWTQR
ncbi:MAG: hypothetical protein GXC94_09460 [Comamonadaceae bacterium]|jgi:hypothetical protein|nr:hypothetical protein [Comamonadaceae bacterium]